MLTSDVYLVLADLVLFSHILVVAFVILGLLAVFIGAVAGWHWVRNPWFRGLHLICIGVVVMQAWAGVICPLTTLEMWLRSQAGEVTYAGSFISYWMQELLYYDLPTWVFTLIYTVFGGVVALSWILVRPRSFAKR